MAVTPHCNRSAQNNNSLAFLSTTSPFIRGIQIYQHVNIGITHHPISNSKQISVNPFFKSHKRSLTCMQTQQSTTRILHLHPSTVGRLLPALASPQQLRLHILPLSTLLDRTLTSLLLLIVLHLTTPPFSVFLRLSALLFPLWRAFLSACSQNARLRVRTKASRVRLIVADAIYRDDGLYFGTFRMMGVRKIQVKKVVGKTCCALVVGGVVVEAFCPKVGTFIGHYPYVRRGVFRKVCGKAIRNG